MLVRMRLPKTVLWVINLLGIYLLLFTIFRVVTFFAFRPQPETFTDILPSFILGLRFDLRWISLLLLPIVLSLISFGNEALLALAGALAIAGLFAYEWAFVMAPQQVPNN